MAEEKRLVDFDHQSEEYANDPWSQARALAEQYGVAWSDAHGGHWVVASYEAVTQATRTPAVFSSRHDLPTGSTPFEGINLPGTPIRWLPIELDPPLHTAWRQAMTSFFSPAGTDKLRPWMDEYITWCIDQFIEDGEADLVSQLAVPVPAMLTLKLLGMPLKGWERYADLTHRINYAVGDERDQMMVAFGDLLGELVVVAHERRNVPRDDLLTCLATMEPEGRPLTDEEILGACGTLVAGGIDTTAAVLSGALVYLDQNQEARQRLIDDPALMTTAVDEFMSHATQSR